MCILHGFVPQNISWYIVVPVVKNKNVKLDSFDNYRPIFLVSMFSKVFELCISSRLSRVVMIDHLQQFEYDENKRNLPHKYSTV